MQDYQRSSKNKINLQQLDQFLKVDPHKKIRTSLSNSVIPTFDITQYRVTLSKKIIDESHVIG
jgi:hypothetical protein